MSQRDGYEHGVPSWIAGAHPDPDQAAAFYTELFGWDAERRGEHLVCTLRGRDVAGFVRGDEPAWRTHVWVESADDTAERARGRGGTVLAEPADVPGVGRTAMLADPAGAVFTVAEPDPHRGAQVVNEPGAWAMSALSTPDTEAATPSTAPSSAGRPTASAPMHAVPPPGLRRRRAVAAGARATSSRSASRATRRAGTSTSGSTTSTPPPSEPPSSAAAC